MDYLPAGRQGYGCTIGIISFANCLLRPRSSTRLSSKLTVSLTIFFFMSSFISPPIETGVAAPMLVACKAPFTWQACKMIAPALPACPPLGATRHKKGFGEFKIFFRGKGMHAWWNAWLKKERGICSHFVMISQNIRFPFLKGFDACLWFRMLGD